jgi:glycosyltransferase involved in cell wall biosynthesis
MTEKCVALLGRRDHPTDAVEEYCRYLGEALRPHGFEAELARVNWAEMGWPAALSGLRKKACDWRGQWILLQYTALAWSKRGFPVGFLAVVHLLRHRGARVAVVYHDVDAYPGGRGVHNVRRSVQLGTMRRALVASELAVLTVPLEKVGWLPPHHSRAVFIPVGANLPPQAIGNANDSLHQPPGVAVFGITGGDAGHEETQAIISAVQLAAEKIGTLRLKVFGRHADLREGALREAFRDLRVQLEISGILSGEGIARELAASDVLLFARGPISSRRGSAVAGIACGLPVIAYSGSETAPPITEAGVVLVSRDNRHEAAEALVRVLTDRPYHDALVRSSRAAYERYFSWPAIAARYAEALRPRS